MAPARRAGAPVTSPFAARLAGTLASLAAFALLAATAAYWGWRWFGPVPQPLPRAPVDDVATALTLSPPFGVSQETVTPGPVLAAPAGDLRLLGVLAEAGGGGRALFRLGDGTARLAAAGESLGAAGTLARIDVDGVTLRGEGGERRIVLRPERGTMGAAPQASPKATSCVPPGYRGPVVRLNAELVSGLIAQPQALAAVAEAKDGALVVRDEAGFAALLGLRKGDRVTQANGIALRAPEDVIVAVLRPLAANQAVRMSGTRGAEPQELLIVNAAACR